MAQITGSSTIDWSDISVAQVDFETDIVTFVNRNDQIENEFSNGEFFLVFVSPTLLVVDLFSGGRLSIGGSGFDGTSPLIINSVNFKNPPDGTGEVVRWTGTLDGIGNDLLTSATIGSTGFSETINGNIIVSPTFPDPPGTYTATLTSLVVKIGAAKGILSGNFHLTGDLVSASLTGTVTGISVLSGADTIKMTGLALSLDVLEAALASDDLATVNDLFSFVGNQLSGNDVITYTNNSAVGITLYGGEGNDTMTVIGANADTLVGGNGNDTYVHVAGGASDSFIENPDEGSDTIRAAVTLTLPDASQNIENLTLTGSGNIDGTGNSLNNVLTGNTGNNVLSGGDGNDQLKGGAGNDTLDGGTGDDVLMGGTGNDTYTVDVASDVVTEGLTAGTDKVFSASIDYTLAANVENLELTGSADINGTGNALANIITGNGGVNILTGLAGNDLLNGGAGDDTLTGGDGNDVIVIENAADHGAGEEIDGGTGTDVIRFTSATPDETLTLALGVTTVERVVIGTAAGITTGTIALNVDASALGSGLSITGNAGANILIGTSANDTLRGGADNDTLGGGTGIDTLIGGTGNDTFLFGLGDGLDKVQDTSGAADKILFDSGIDPLNLVISRRVDNLRIAIHGSADQITVQNWYTSSVNRTETIQAGNGQTLLSTQVNQLIQAMASFTQDTGLSWDAASGGGGTAEQQAQFQGIVAASWQ